MYVDGANLFYDEVIQANSALVKLVIRNTKEGDEIPDDAINKALARLTKRIESVMELGERLGANKCYITTEFHTSSPDKMPKKRDRPQALLRDILYLFKVHERKKNANHSKTNRKISNKKMEAIARKAMLSNPDVSGSIHLIISNIIDQLNLTGTFNAGSLKKEELVDDSSEPTTPPPMPATPIQPPASKYNCEFIYYNANHGDFLMSKTSTPGVLHIVVSRDSDACMAGAFANNPTVDRSVHITQFYLKKKGTTSGDQSDLYVRARDALATHHAFVSGHVPGYCDKVSRSGQTLISKNAFALRLPDKPTGPQSFNFYTSMFVNSMTGYSDNGAPLYEDETKRHPINPRLIINGCFDPYLCNCLDTGKLPTLDGFKNYILGGAQGPKCAKLKRAAGSGEWIKFREELIMTSSALFEESLQSTTTLNLWRKEFLDVTSEEATKTMDAYQFRVPTPKCEEVHILPIGEATCSVFGGIRKFITATRQKASEEKERKARARGEPNEKSERPQPTYTEKRFLFIGNKSFTTGMPMAGAEGQGHKTYKQLDGTTGKPNKNTRSIN